IGLALAVVVGTATKEFVSAIVDDVIMPFVQIFLPGGDWKELTVYLVGSEFKVGHLLGAVIDFLIILFLVYLFVRYALKKEEVEKI
ncbi:MAG: MscL family protein, partial [Candidatus Aenigmatarchaeota archaeon]